jgi:glycosyltransferase involved in cell wall biosynthesis
MLMEHWRVLKEAGWEVRVFGGAANHDVAVEQIAIHFRSTRLSTYEYYWRFVRENPSGVLLAYDEPGVAMFAPTRSIIRFSWPTALPRYWRTAWALPRFRKATYLFPSNAARESWSREHALIPAANTHVIWNGVDLQLFRPEQKTGGHYRVGFAGQWSSDKGLGVLIAAWEEVRRKCPRAELWMAGGPDLWQRTAPVPDEKLAVVKELEKIRDKGLHLVGVMPRHQMPAFWAQVDLACVPSTCEEQFGLVAAEAMACGTPLVVSASGALPEIVGDAGVVVPKGDHMALAEAIVGLLHSPVRLLRLGECAHQRATLFNRQDGALQLLSLVEQVANGASGH